MTIEITGQFVPKNNGSFPIVEDIDLKGGFRVVDDIPSRDAIAVLDRKIGMVATCNADGYWYQLVGGIANINWQIVNLGGSGGSATAKQETIAVTAPGQVSFVLTALPSQSNTVEMFINGMKQDYGTDYTCSMLVVSYLGGLSLQVSDVVEFWYLTGSSGGSGSSQTLAQTLVLGNTTGGTNISINNGDSITGESGSGSGAGGNINLTSGIAGSTGAGGDINISASDAGAGAVNANNGGNLIVTSGAGGSDIGATGNGGDITIISGGSSTASGNGGLFLIIGGDANNGTGSGGAIGITSGNSASGGGGADIGLHGAVGINGGILELKSGSASGAGTVGTTTITTGIAGNDGAGGDINITASSAGVGLTNASNGGNLLLTSGDGGNQAGSTGSGGNITITTGAGLNGIGSGGNFSLTSGAGIGGGSSGNITITCSDSADTSSGPGSIVLSASGSLFTSTNNEGGNVSISAGSGLETGGDLTLNSGWVLNSPNYLPSRIKLFGAKSVSQIAGSIELKGGAASAGATVLNPAYINLLFENAQSGIGGNINITGGRSALDNGGDINIISGTSNGIGFFGGALSLSAGTGENGGNTLITSGDSNPIGSTVNQAGNISIIAGAAFGTAVGNVAGNVIITAGAGTHYGGEVIITGGSGGTEGSIGDGYGGHVTIQGGIPADGYGGDVFISATNAATLTSGNWDGGNIVLSVGNKTNSGNDGKIKLAGNSITSATANNTLGGLTLPALAATYLVLTVNGIPYKIPCYAN